MSTPRLYSLIRVTPGGRHGWYDSSLGFPLKKPLGSKMFTPSEDSVDNSESDTKKTPTK